MKIPSGEWNHPSDYNFSADDEASNYALNNEALIKSKAEKAISKLGEYKKICNSYPEYVIVRSAKRSMNRAT